MKDKKYDVQAIMDKLDGLKPLHLFDSKTPQFAVKDGFRVWDVRCLTAEQRVVLIQIIRAQVLQLDLLAKAVTFGGYQRCEFEPGECEACHETAQLYFSGLDDAGRYCCGECVISEYLAHDSVLDEIATEAQKIEMNNPLKTMGYVDDLQKKIGAGKTLSLEEQMILLDAATKWRGIAASFATDLTRYQPMLGCQVADVMEYRQRVDITADHYDKVAKKARQIGLLYQSRL